MKTSTDPERIATTASSHLPERLIANHLEVRQGFAKSVEANELLMRQAVTLRSTATDLGASASALGWVKAQSVSIQNSQSGAVIASGDAKIDQSGSYAVVANGNVTLDQCGTVVMVAPNVSIKDSNTVFLFAKHVEGNVTTLFNSQDAVIFGVVAGLVGGLFMLLGRIFRRR